MNIEEIRTELLGQHADLRRMIEEVQRSVRQIQQAQNAELDRELPARVQALARALREHNLREEELLGNILPTIDAWGSVRKEIMEEQHAEHEQFTAALVASETWGDPARGRETLMATLARVLEHMEREEKAFLNETLLRDDSVVADQFSG
ncbi:MAG TPA: hemerythrin domain-containing protein [Polyangiaceae bacterium]|nr:hemerythrin domain-containing protein [Polyangiaceae bacterium]